MAPGDQIARLAIEDSQKFAALVRSAMAECGISSIYSLYLEADDIPRATLYRWLSGTVRVPISGARGLIEALARCSGRSESARDLERWIDVAVSVTRSTEERLRLELLARGVPVRRALEAARAAQLLSTESPQR